MEAVTLTEAARARMNQILDATGGDALVLSINGRGCGGYSYDIAQKTEDVAGPQIPLTEGRVLIVDEISVPFVLGTCIDWHDTAMAASFVFDNPMAGGTCGCGSSFSIRGC